MQYALCDRIGTGGYITVASGQPEIFDPYRPVVADYGCSYIAIDKQGNGQAGFWVKFTGGDEAGALADNRVDAFPIDKLTDIVGAGQATFVNNKLSTKYGITTNPVSAGMTWQQALDAVLAAYDPTADMLGLKLNGLS